MYGLVYAKINQHVQRLAKLLVIGMEFVKISLVLQDVQIVILKREFVSVHITVTMVVIQLENA